MICLVAPRWVFLSVALALLITFSGCKKKADELVVTPVIPEVKTLPRLDIATAGNAQINSTDTYVTATISVDGLDASDNYKGSAQIRGRGNSTWDSKIPLGAQKALRWILGPTARLLGYGK